MDNLPKNGSELLKHPFKIVIEITESNSAVLVEGPLSGLRAQGAIVALEILKAKLLKEIQDKATQSEKEIRIPVNKGDIN